MKSSLIIFSIIFVLNSLTANSQELSTTNYTSLLNLPPDAELFVLQQFLKLQELLNSLINDPALMHSKCLKDVLNVVDALPRKEEWAIKMLDAFAKPQTSLLTGNIMHIGSYDECLSIEELEYEIHGKYCTVPLKIMASDYTMFFRDVKEAINDSETTENVQMFRDFLFQLKSSYGICIPISCNSTHLSLLWSHLKDGFELDGFKDRGIVFIDDYCMDKNSNDLQTTAIVAIGVFAAIVALLILSTLYDVLLVTKNKQARLAYSETLVAFSLYTNGKRLFFRSSSENQLACMNGLRVISMMWILFMHRIAISAFLPYINTADILNLRDKYYTTVIFGAHFSVDTFFTISGILLSYTYLIKREKSSDNWPYFFIHRYLRLTPSLAAVILITATLTKNLGDGPFWPIVDEVFQKPCANSWWVDLLYLQNYIDREHRCVTQAWYLAVDTQLYMLSPILLIPLVKIPKLTIIFSSLLTIFGIGLNFAINYINDYSANFFNQDDDYQNGMYIPTHTRYGPWLIGFILGYILFKCKHKKVKINKWVVFLLWVCSLSIFLALTYSNWYFINEPHNRLNTSIFNSVCRQFWGLAMCWIIFACIHGYGGFVNRFLSLPIFNIAIRINYAMYLVHFAILAILIVRTRIAGYFSLLQMCHQFYGDLFVTLIVSVLWTLTFESPVVSLEKIILTKLANRNIRDKRQSQSTTISITVTNNDKIR